jgi:hypothetical protein
MSNTPKESPTPMTRQEYERRHADACVKADVAPGPGLPCNEAVGAEDAQLTSQAWMKSAGGGEVRESPIAGSA